MRRIKIAQIGTSRYSHGTDIFKCLTNHPDVFEVVGYAFPEGEREKFPERLSSFAGYPELTVDEILSDPTIEAVTVETEEIYLTKYALMAARAGKHIHMEKPGGLSESDFELLIDTMRGSNLVFHTGYMYRYNPVISDIINRVKNGEIGDVISVEAQMSGWRGFDHTDWLRCFDGGMMFFLGCHLIDLVLLLQGPPKRIIPFNKTSGAQDSSAKDFSFALFEYENGVSFVKTTQAERGGFARRQLVVTGTKGKFEVRPLETSINYPLQFTEYTKCMSENWNDKGEHFRSEDHDRYETMMLSFAKMVRGEKQNPYTYDYELDLFKTIKECCK